MEGVPKKNLLFFGLSLYLFLPLPSLLGQQISYPAAVDTFEVATASSPLDSFSIEDLANFKEYYQLEIENLEREKTALIATAIKDGEKFISQNSESSVLDKVLIRLAELYYELAEEKFIQQMQEYEHKFSEYEKGLLAEPPKEPVKDFTLAIEKYQMLLDRCPQSELVDDALYHMAFALEQSQQQAAAKDLYQRLVDQFPKSKYVPEALMQIAEYYFNPPVNDIEKAIEYYKEIMAYKDIPRYDEALYKLGWSYFRLSQYPQAIAYFTLLVEDINRYGRLDPAHRFTNPNLAEEAKEYIGISFHDFAGPARSGAEVASEYLQAIGNPKYGADILKKIGDIYKDVRQEYTHAAQSYQILLSKYPYTPMAPELQNEIVDCDLRARDPQKAYSERKGLFEKYKPGSEWSRKVKDKKVLAKAHRLAEKALRENINYLLEQAQKGQDTQFFQLAVDNSRKYLKYFPADTSAPLIHWNLAVTLDTKLKQYDAAYNEYVGISNLYEDPQYKKDAARNAIVVAKALLEKAHSDTLSGEKLLVIGTEPGGKKEDRIHAKNFKRAKLSASEKRLVEAYDNFIKLFPHDAETSVILANAGALYYNHNNFPEALKYFQTLIARFPDSPEIDRARYMVMESYFGRKDFAGTEIIAKKIKTSAAPKEIKEKAERRLSESIFLHAENLAKEGKSLEAAKEFQRVVVETPEAQFVDLALFNSAVQYDQAKDYAQAVKQYQRLIDSFPRSDRYLDALNNLAIDYGELKLYEKAALTYERLAKIYPDSSKAQDALYNSSLYYAKAENWKEAIRVIDLFVQSYPNSKDAEGLYYERANYYLKMNDTEGVQRAYGEFCRLYPSSPRVVEAHFRRGQYYLKKDMREEAAREFRMAVAKSDELKEAGKEPNDFFAAEALFSLAQLEYQDYDTIDFNLGNKQTNKKRKKELLARLVNQYTKVASYGTPRLYEATYNIGKAYEEFAKTWAQQEIPPMEETKQVVYGTKINKTSAELYDKAVDSYKDAVKVLTRIADNYKKTTKGITANDSVLALANEWISRSQDKISENLFRIAEINFKSIYKLLEAPIPSGLDEVASLEYKNQVLAKAVKPVIDEIVTAHKRHIQEAKELGLLNTWVENSKEKIVTTSNILSHEYKKLWHDALQTYQKKFVNYLRMIQSSTEEEALAALNVANQMVNLIELSSGFAAATVMNFKRTLEDARSIGIENDAVNATKEETMKSIYEIGSDYLAWADSTRKQKERFAELFRKEGKLEYEDASFTLEENSSAFRQDALKTLESGYSIQAELGIENPWLRKIFVELVKADPKKYAAQLSVEIVDYQIASDSTWVAAVDSLAGWSDINFDDSSWKGVKVVNSPTMRAANLDSLAVQRIWYASTEDTERPMVPIDARVTKAFFRKNFTIEGIPISSELLLSADGKCSVFLNGKNITHTRRDSTGSTNLLLCQISNYLKKGENVVAIEGSSANGLGVLLKIEYIPDSQFREEDKLSISEGKSSVEK